MPSFIFCLVSLLIVKCHPFGVLGGIGCFFSIIISALRAYIHSIQFTIFTIPKGCNFYRRTQTRRNQKPRRGVIIVETSLFILLFQPIKQIFLIEFNIKFFQKIRIFFLECLLFMMFFLS